MPEGNEPLIFTSKGNLPIALLREDCVWTVNEDEAICCVQHWLGDELVRNQVNVLKLKGESALVEVGVF